MLTEEQLHWGLYHAIYDTGELGFDASRFGEVSKGKVRDSFVRNGRRVVVTTDRVSAFDAVVGTIPFRGQMLNRITSFWFEVTQLRVPNAVLAVPDPNITVYENCTPLPVEMIVREYLTGNTPTSIWKHYERGARSFCGYVLPDGMKKHEQLPHPIVTPSSKAKHGEHDESLSKDEILKRTGMDAEHYETAERYALDLFGMGRDHCASQGLILADTKYEFGLNSQGEVVLIDEVHTPDSSRYWDASAYEQAMARRKDPGQLDKEHLRLWLVARGFVGDGEPPMLSDEIQFKIASVYADVFERITESTFIPDMKEPKERLRKALEMIET